MVRLRRRNTLWLTALGLLIALGLLTETTMALPVQAFFVLSYLGVWVASMVEFGAGQNTLLDQLRQVPVRGKITPDGKEALERAKGRGGFMGKQLTLLDMGMIAIQTDIGQMQMRKAKSVSKDDDGVRPFIMMHVQRQAAGRNAVVRFEVDNHYGERLFVHEQRSFLREGEMNIIADHQLRLRDNDEIAGTGDWEVRAYVDNNLVGVQTFSLSPSVSERNRRLSGASEEKPRSAPQTASAPAPERRIRTRNVAFDVVDEEPQPRPARLQDLLEQPAPEERLNLNTARRQRTGRDDVE